MLISIDSNLFRRFQSLALEHAGIHLREGKEALVAARVSKRLRALRIDSPREYLSYLETDQTGEEVLHFLDVISTNFTGFFREEDHFDYLEEVFKEWLSSGQRRFRFWSTASSTGEEPYSLAITMEQALQARQVDYLVLATDISRRALLSANQGVYPAKALAPVGRLIKARYFNRSGSGSDPVWQVRPELRSKMVFRRLNLARPPFPMKGPLDVVLCRNVMIYFENEVRLRLVREMVRLLRPGGILIVGHAETLAGLDSGMSSVRPSIYRK